MSDTLTKPPVDTKHVCFTVELTEDQALAYAQFLKRVCFSDYMDHAVDKDEAYQMMYAGERIREGLASAGFSPR
ncbi:MAG: hypothetical protein IDH49_08090 [Gammaproteobacteria bacterium]|nr:hypothetical protein [Gammaproteobacteria bacterium]